MALTGTSTNATQISRPSAPSGANDNTSYVMQPSSDPRHCWWDSSHLAARPRSITKLNDDPIPNPPTLGVSSTCSLCRIAPRATTLETNRNRHLSETFESKSSYSPPSSYNHEQSVRGEVCQDNVYYIDSWSAACLEPSLKPTRPDPADNAKDVGLQTLKYIRANGSISKKAVPSVRCSAAYPGTHRLPRTSPSAKRESRKSNFVCVSGRPFRGMAFLAGVQDWPSLQALSTNGNQVSDTVSATMACMARPMTGVRPAQSGPEHQPTCHWTDYRHRDMYSRPAPESVGEG